jgi:hypothetical protein
MIYDDCSASVETDNTVQVTTTEVERGVRLDPKEWHKKKDMLQELCDLNKGKLSKGPFTLVKREKNSAANKIVFCFFTRDFASLNVALVRYSDGSCFLCTRGSPTKVLSGQNIESVKDHEAVTETRKNLKCTAFEAMSVIGFYLVNECCELSLGRRFFTAKECNRLDNLDIGIYSLTFASEVPFGKTIEERNFNLNLLGELVTSTVKMHGTSFSLLDYLKVTGKSWNIITEEIAEQVNESGEQSLESSIIRGPNTGVLLKKVRSNGLLLVKQMYYLKEEQAVAMGPSGLKNLEVIKGMSAQARSEKSLKIRVDNTFGKEYIREWLGVLNAKDSSEDITIRDANPLCDSLEYLTSMALCATNDLGLRTLMLGPTIADIRQIEANEDGFLNYAELDILGRWLLEPTGVKEVGKKGLKLDWVNITASDMAAWRLNQKLMMRNYLDLRLPFGFYQSLNVARADHFIQGKGRQALDAARNRDTGKGSFSEELEMHSIESIQKARALISRIRGSVYLPVPRSKESFVAEIANHPISKNL